jgi:hypothetical protein
MVRKEIIPFGVDLNKVPPWEDSLAIIPIEEHLPLVVIPPKQVATVPLRRNYEQSYYAQVHQPMPSPPQDRILLKDAPKGPKIVVPKDIKLLPSWPNETLVGVKTNKLGEVTCVKYTTATPFLMVFELHHAKSNLFHQGRRPKDLLHHWKEKRSAQEQPLRC